MFARFVLAALAAGLLAGLAYAGLQEWRVVPLIHYAETFEGNSNSVKPDPSAHTHSTRDHDTLNRGGASQLAQSAAPALTPLAAAPSFLQLDDHSSADHHSGEVWAPENGFERRFYSFITTLMASTGFALSLLGIALVSGLPLNRHTGYLWGMAGFIAIALIPSMGLPPGLPGMAAAQFEGRQLWWVMAITCASTGLFCWAKFHQPLGFMAGLVFLILPFLIMAPAPTYHSGAVPAELAAAFVANSLVSAAIFWGLLGSLLGWFIQSFTLGFKEASYPDA